ncbi:MAG: hypothetical protein ISR64_00250 [Deltaproteobacteria bacterium]|nr:hypothetical protein [Deltaproteobacteria bacterium]
MKTAPYRTFPILLVIIGVLASQWACEEAREPTYTHTAILEGSAYHRGYEHGQLYGPDIRSLYTRLLTNSILPFLNREQISIAPILKVYNGPAYVSDEFSLRMLLESGRNLFDHHIPKDIRWEMRGIADGAGIDLDDIIVLNTFVDTMMAFRAVVIFIKHIQTPYVTAFGFSGGMDGDQVDNDDDGETDEEGEGSFDGLSPSPFATLLEVPPDATVRIVFEDAVLGGLACPDPRNIEPIGSMEVRADCVEPALKGECVIEACLDRDLLTPECMDLVAQECMYPRLRGDCFIPDCIEMADPGCVDPDSIRIRVGDVQYEAGDGTILTNHIPWEGEGLAPGQAPDTNPHTLDCQGQVEVLFTPPGGFEAASAISMLLQVGDLSPIYSPAPFHARYMRDEQVTFTTQGYAAATGEGKHLQEVNNRGMDDGTTQPTSISFGVRGSATPGGNPLLAHHFALLDSDMVHEHSALLVHVPETSEGRPHVLVTWTGLVWGFSGMNDQGLAYAVNTSDSLDSPLVGGILKDILEPENLLKLLENTDLVGLTKVLENRRLLATGLPAGIAGRQLLLKTSNVDEALAFLHGSETTFGWNFLLADAEGGLAAVEMDSATQDESGGPGDTVEERDGFFYYTPDAGEPGNLDGSGQPWASEGADDLRMASHFRKNVEDMETLDFMGIFSPLPQRLWTGMYYRSVRAWYNLGEAIRIRLGTIDVGQAIEILRIPELVDTRDSMNAAIFEPAAGRLHWAMGEVPATDADFEVFDLAGALKEVAR